MKRIVIFALCFVMSLLPWYFRNNTILAGFEPYSPAHSWFHSVSLYVLANFGSTAYILLFSILSLLCMILLWQLLENLGLKGDSQFWVLFVFALSPILMTQSFLGLSYLASACLLLAGAVFILKNNLVLGIIFMCAGAFGSTEAFISSVFLVMIFSGLKKINPNKALLCVLLLIGVAIFSFSDSPVFFEESRVTYVSDVGGLYGLSIFAVLLAGVGFSSIWEYRRKHLSVFLGGLIFCALSALFPYLLFFVNIFVSVIAGIGFEQLAKRKWAISLIRSASLLVLACGLLFSGVAHAKTLSESSPSAGLLDLLDVPKGVVVSAKEYGYFIESKRHFAVLTPGIADPDSGWDVNLLFNSVDVVKSSQILEKHNIDYILITPKMKSGLIWDKEDQGLVFLLKNSEMFKILRETEYGELWQVCIKNQC